MRALSLDIFEVTYYIETINDCATRTNEEYAQLDYPFSTVDDVTKELESLGAFEPSDSGDCPRWMSSEPWQNPVTGSWFEVSVHPENNTDPRWIEAVRRVRQY